MSEKSDGLRPGAVDYDAEHAKSLEANLRNLLPESIGAVCPGCSAMWDVAVRSDVQKMNSMVWTRIEGLSNTIEQKKHETREKHAKELAKRDSDLEARTTTVKELESKIAVHEAERSEGARQVARLEQNESELRNKIDRLENEMGDKVEAGRDELATTLLPVTDAIEDAIKHTEALGDGSRPYVEGIRMLRKSVDTLLQSAGYQAMVVIGEELDAELHESVSSVESPDHAPGHIVEEVQRGYINAKSGKVMRYAKVSVADENSGTKLEDGDDADQDGSEPAEDEDDVSTEDADDDGSADDETAGADAESGTSDEAADADSDDVETAADDEGAEGDKS